MHRLLLIVMMMVASMLPANAAGCSDAKVRALARDSEFTTFVAVGKIVRVGQPPGYWSGQFPAHQRVEYQVEEVLKGKIPERRITVAYAIVSGDELLDGDKPQLSPKLFPEGGRQILFLRENRNYKFVDEKTQPVKVYLGGEVCSLADSDRLIDVIRSALAAG
jgi:hypothetical protein